MRVLSPGRLARLAVLVLVCLSLMAAQEEPDEYEEYHEYDEESDDYSGSGSYEPLPPAECGDGFVDAKELGEECDDGNLAAFDGCTGDCRIDQGWECDFVGDGEGPSDCSRVGAGPGDFYVEAIVPAAGLYAGGTAVVVFVDRLDEDGSDQVFSCLFDGVAVAAAKVPGLASALKCYTPALAAGAAAYRRVSFLLRAGNAPIEQDESIGFMYYRKPELVDVAPRVVHTSGTETLTLFGRHFDVGLKPETHVMAFLAERALVGSEPDALAIQVDMLGDVDVVGNEEMTVGLLYHTVADDLAVGVSFNYDETLGRLIDVTWLDPDVANATIAVRRCAPGSYSESDYDACQLCPAGTHQPNAGATRCLVCDASSFSETRGAVRCESCASNMEILAEPRSNGTMCTCKPGTYLRAVDQGATGPTECVECKTGGFCAGGDAQPVPRQGYWTDDLANTVFLPCPNADSCMGGVGDASCRPGSTGRLCAQCEPDFYESGGRCHQCPKSAKLFFFVAIGLGVLVAGLAYRIVTRHGTQHMAAITILASFFQVLEIVISMDLSWPASVEDGVTYMTLPFAFNADLLATECSLPVGFIFKWLTILLLPAVFALFFLILFLVLFLAMPLFRRRRLAQAKNDGSFRVNVADHSGSGRETTVNMRGTTADDETEDAGESKESKDPAAGRLSVLAALHLIPGHYHQLDRGDIKALQNHVIHAFIMVMLLLYMIVGEATLDFFDCRPLPDGSFLLESSPSLECYTTWWFYWLPLAASALVLYTIGLPIGIFFFLRRSRERLNDPQFAERYGTLYLRYRISAAGWESAIMVRKLSILAAARLISNANPQFQGTVIVCILAVAIRMQDVHRPMAIPAFNRLESVLLYCCLAIVAAGLNFSSAQLDDSSALYIALLIAVWTVIGISFLILLYVVLDVILKSQRLSRGARMDPATQQMLMTIIQPGDMVVVRKWLGDAVVPPETRAQFVALAQNLAVYVATAKVDKYQATHVSIPMVSAFCFNILKRPAVPAVVQWLLAADEDERVVFRSVFETLAQFKTNLKLHQRKHRHAHRAHHAVAAGNSADGLTDPRANEADEHDACTAILFPGEHASSALANFLQGDKASDSFFMDTREFFPSNNNGTDAEDDSAALSATQTAEVDIEMQEM